MKQADCERWRPGSCRARSAPRSVVEYDAEYDRGRTKKVRRKDGPDGGISAATFQDAWTDRRQQSGALTAALHPIAWPAPLPPLFHANALKGATY